MRHQFTLTLRLPPNSDDPLFWLDALAAAGCDDATIGVEPSGCMALCFTREGRSRFAAIVHAVREVSLAIPGAQVEQCQLGDSGLLPMPDALYPPEDRRGQGGLARHILVTGDFAYGHDDLQRMQGADQHDCGSLS